MIQFVLCDDNPLHNRTLANHLEWLLPKLREEACIAFQATDANAVIDYAKTAREGRRIYLLDLVLERQDLNGLDICDAIHAHDPAAYVVYVSAYPEYALECCQSHAFDFILKPYTPERLEACIRAVLRNMRAGTPETPLTVHVGSRIQQFDQQEIRCIEARRDYATAYLADSKRTWRESLSKLMERLDEDWFARVHRGYIVNRKFVDHADLRARTLTLQDGRVLPISRKYASALREAEGKERRHVL